MELRLVSSFLARSRRVQVYLPASYWQRPFEHYPVLVLHDGQNVFSSAREDTTFGWGSWGLDGTADSLSKAGKMQEIIMVAIDNSPARMEEYSGDHSSKGSRGKTAFEKYESFVSEELKPRIDLEFRTLPAAPQTAVMGSSMGGICSLVLAWDHPEIFGGAASLSGAFTLRRPNFVDDLLGEYNGPPKPFRAYLDSGVVDSAGGDDGRARTDKVAAEFRRIGWTGGGLTRFLDKEVVERAELAKSGLRRGKWDEALRSQHNEFYWGRRAWRALTFLFPGTPR